MGIKMSLGSSDTQATTASSVVTSRTTAYLSVIAALEVFIGASNLQGTAYSGAKAYAGNILIPLLKSAIMFSEELSSGTSSLPTTYRSDVGQEDLDEETLEAQITAQDGIIENYNAIISEVTKLGLKDSVAGLQEIKQNLQSAQTLRDSYQEKLTKLRNFAAGSATLLSGAENMYSSVMQGLTMIGADFKGFNGSFHSAPTDWSQNIQSSWGVRNKATNLSKKSQSLEELQRLIERANQGDSDSIDKLIAAYDYKNAVGTAPILTDEEKQVRNAEVWKRTEEFGKNLLGEFTGIYDIKRLIDGKDPVTGEDANRFEAGVWTLMNLIPIAKGAGKVAKAVDTVGDVAKVVDKIDDVVDAAKAVDKTTDTAKVVDKIQDIGKTADTSKDVAKSGDVISKNIQASELTMTETVKNHANDVIKRGKYVGDKARPFVDNAGTDLIIQEIIYGGIPVKDKYLPNGWRWEVEGSFNGRSNGIWELVVDLDTNQIVHFNFINR